MLRKVISDESGRALVLALIVLGIGALLIPVFLAHASTNLAATRVTEKGLKEQYAADAGVDGALWHLLGGLEVPEEGWALPESTINGKAVNVLIEEVEGWQIFKITSIASSDDESSTTIVSYVYVPLDYSWLFDHGITSPGTVTLQPGSVVTGGIRSPEQPGGQGDYDSWTEDPVDDWPTAGHMSSFYWEDVKDLEPYLDDTIDLKDTNSIGPLYRDGDLDIKNTGSETTATLAGTVYVTGDLEFKQPGGPGAYTIDLNGQTVYVEGSITFPSQRCTISGSGAIIAVGDVIFQPGIDSSPDDFVFVMSVEGETRMQPQGDFYGAVAGEVRVDLQPNCSLTLTDSEGKLNFPDITGLGITTYNINP